MITFCTCSVVIKVDLLVALFFPLWLGMLIEVDKRAAFRKVIDDEKYEILKQLAIGKFVKRMEKRSRKKSTVNKFCRSKGKYTELDEALNSRKKNLI